MPVHRTTLPGGRENPPPRGFSHYQAQQGSVLIILVSLVATILLIFLVGNIALHAKTQNNELPAKKQAYLDRAEEAIKLWYRKNALTIDSAACPAYSEEDLFKETMITREFGARIAITTNCLQRGSEIKYRNVVIWIPADGSFADPDTSAFTTDQTGFKPHNAGVQYRLIDGYNIEAKMLAETKDQLSEMSRLLELWFRAKIDGDPERDLSLNYFAAYDCSVNGGLGLALEMPCFDEQANMLGEPLQDPVAGKAAKLAQLALLPQSMNRDAWGRFILIANKLVKPTGANKHPCLTEDKPDPEYPPYRMMLQSITPWGHVITACPIQPIN